MKRIVRVFPRKTSWTPDDENVIICRGPGFFEDIETVAEVHISVLFEQDVKLAEVLAASWSKVISPVRIGGVGFGDRGGDFVPGMYVKKGAVITSRGCPNRCWFCSVWKREGNIVRELPITDGWNIFDDNLLRCSEKHVRAVFEMLSRQPRRALFSGGLEAAALKDWHVDLFECARIERMFFAYDTKDDYEPLVVAGRMFQRSRLFSYNYLRAYVLVGYPDDTLDKAERRCWQCLDAGFMPMAMLYSDFNGRVPSTDWRRFQREWARPAIMRSKLKRRQLT